METTQTAQVEETKGTETTTKAKKGGKAKAKVARTPKGEKPGAWKKDPKKIAQLKKDIPVGSTVRYTGSRVEAHAGKQGTVVGHRDANGLIVDFGKAGKGTISVPKATLVRKGAAKKEAKEPATASA